MGHKIDIAKATQTILNEAKKAAASTESIDAMLTRWQESPYLFVRDALGVTPSAQQQEYLQALGQLVNAKILLAAGKKTPESEKIGISIMSGKGTGKDAVLAWTIIWVLSLFPRAKVPVTGPSYDQVKDILWNEIGKWLKRMDAQGNFICPYHDALVIKSDTINRRGEGMLDDRNSTYARIRTAPSGADQTAQAQVMAGWHEDIMFVIADEASSVPDATLTQLDTTMTQPVNIAILAFNPTRKSGFAYNTHFGESRNRWITLKWDSRESELVSSEQLARMKETYGEDSPEYRMFVVGMPPEDDSRALIPYSWVEQSVGRELEEPEPPPVVIGVDVARQGEDLTVLLCRQGRRVIDIKEFRKSRTDEIVEEILNKIAEVKCEHEVEVHGVYIDTIGYGAGVYDYLRKQFPRTYAVDVSRSATRTKFARLRDEYWWRLRDMFMNGTISLPNHRKLISELSTIRLKESGDTSNKTKVESKKDMRSRGMPSPNYADALMLTMAAPADATLAAVSKSSIPADLLEDAPYKGAVTDAWMVM